MKKFIFIFASLFLSLSLIARDPDENLIKVFSSSFPKAEQVHWYEMPKAWVVNFVADGIRSRIVYMKNGKVTEFTRYYLEADLPFLIHSRIKSAYPGKKIFGVVEVSIVTESGSMSSMNYYVKLEDDKNWITVKSDNEGNLTVTEKYKKAQ